MRTNIKRIDMLKILLLAKFKDSKFCYIIILRVAKQLIQLNNNYRYSDNSGSDTWWKSNILAKSAEGLRNESGASKGSQYCCGSTGAKPVRNPEREKPKWEDTITNRMLHWSYTPEQKEEVKKALAAGVPKATILTYFYAEVTVEKMSSYRNKH